MKQSLKLFMILLGFKPKGFKTEQHDILFAIGTSIDDDRVKKSILTKLPVPIGTEIHMDAYVDVEFAHGHRITVAEGPNHVAVPCPDLFFANLGGYKNGDFQEYHKKLLFVLSDVSKVKVVAQEDSFYREMEKIKGAPPHLDDKFALNAEVEDELRVQEDIEGYHLVIESVPECPDSLKTPVITGWRVVGRKGDVF